MSWRRGRIFCVTKGPCPQFWAPSPPWSPRGLRRWPLNHCRLIKEVGQLHQAHVGLPGRGLRSGSTPLWGPCSSAEPHLRRSLGACVRSLGSLGGCGAVVGGRVATTVGTPRIGCRVGGCGSANEVPHCQGELEELRQVLGEVSFMGWAESWP